MKLLLNIAASIALLACLAKGALASDIMVMNALAPESLTPSTRTAAVYMSIMNHGVDDDALLSAASPAAGRVTIHETTMENDVAKMGEVERLAVPAGAMIDLKPAATHLMLTSLKAPLKAGETLSLTLTFEKAGEIRLDVPVVDIKALPGMDHDHPENTMN